jgi:hypothetical protein
VRTLTLLLATAALSVPAAPAAAAPPPAQVSLVSCHRALRPPDRHVTVEGRMEALGAGARLQMRFDLYRRREGAAAFTRIPGPGLGVYNQAAPGVATYRFRKMVRNLPAPADYRVVVEFRWLTADGTVGARVVRSSPVCRQTDRRPDLRVGTIEVAPGPAGGQATYTVVVRNTGGARAGGFDVGLALAGARQPAVHVPGLAPGGRLAVAFAAPACSAGQAVVASADVSRSVEEASEANNVRGLPCPPVHASSRPAAVATLARP